MIQNRQDACERRSRELGIRVHGIQERPREDTRVMLCKLLVDHKLAGISTMEEASEAIEHCHRLGQFQKGRTRTSIANYFSSPMRNVILKDARAVNNSYLDIYIDEDKIKADQLLKIQARDQMKKAYQDGKKVVFRRGKLIINSKSVQIIGTAQPISDNMPVPPQPSSDDERSGEQDDDLHVTAPTDGRANTHDVNGVGQSPA